MKIFKHWYLIALAILLLATVAVAGVVKKTFDDCEKEGLQHSWVYSVPDDWSWTSLTISADSLILGRSVGEISYTEVSDNNATSNSYKKTIRSRKCRNCNVVEELHVKHSEEWCRKEAGNPPTLRKAGAQ